MIHFTALPNESMQMLCLGDSYTIGQSVEPANRFPEQTVVLLNASNQICRQPDIIARTGWTTTDLLSAIARTNPKNNYDIVTLLIGVNDQYQGMDAVTYRTHFENLLQQAIVFANGKASHVFVLSIPDYSITPFAKNGNLSPGQIAREIASFNAINKQITDSLKANYVDITGISEMAENDPDLLANDGLHPSGKMYAQWAQLLFQSICKMK